MKLYETMTAELQKLAALKVLRDKARNDANAAQTALNFAEGHVGDQEAVFAQAQRLWQEDVSKGVA